MLLDCLRLTRFLLKYVRARSTSLATPPTLPLLLYKTATRATSRCPAPDYRTGCLLSVCHSNQPFRYPGAGALEWEQGPRFSYSPAKTPYHPERQLSALSPFPRHRPVWAPQFGSDRPVHSACIRQTTPTTTPPGSRCACHGISILRAPLHRQRQQGICSTAPPVSIAVCPRPPRLPVHLPLSLVGRLGRLPQDPPQLSTSPVFPPSQASADSVHHHRCLAR